MRRAPPIGARRALRAAAFLALAGLAISGLRAQEEAADESRPARRGRPAEASLGIGQIGRDALYVYGRPAHLDRRGRARLGITVGIGAGLYTVRDEARDWVVRNRPEEYDGLILNGRKYALRAIPVAALGFAIGGWARHAPYDVETGLVIVETVVYSEILTGLTQRVVATDRPMIGNDIRYFGTNGHSVSGDVTLAASLIAPVADRHLGIDDDDTRAVRFWKRFGRGALYGAAGLVAYQRMYSDRHYLPDVYLGYLNGLSIGRMVVDSRRGGRGWRDGDRRRVNVMPAPGGISIVWGWGRDAAYVSALGRAAPPAGAEADLAQSFSSASR